MRALAPPVHTAGSHPCAQSWLFAGAPAEVVGALMNTNATVNLHHYGVSPAAYGGGGPLDTGVLRPVT